MPVASSQSWGPLGHDPSRMDDRKLDMIMTTVLPSGTPSDIREIFTLRNAVRALSAIPGVNRLIYRGMTGEEFKDLRETVQTAPALENYWRNWQNNHNGRQQAASEEFKGHLKRWAKAKIQRKIQLDIETLPNKAIERISVGYRGKANRSYVALSMETLFNKNAGSPGYGKTGRFTEKVVEAMNLYYRAAALSGQPNTEFKKWNEMSPSSNGFRSSYRELEQDANCAGGGPYVEDSDP